MKKYSVIWFILLWILAFTPVDELAKLPALLKHYYSHKAKENALTFAQYLSLHYGEDQSDTSDQPLHEQLPFQSHQLLNSLTVFTPPATENFVLKSPLTRMLVKAEADRYIPYLSIGDIGKVWQPPKMA